MKQLFLFLMLLLWAVPVQTATPTTVDFCEANGSGASATCAVDTAAGDVVYAACGWHNTANFSSFTHNGGSDDLRHRVAVGSANNEMTLYRMTAPDVGSNLNVVCTISGSQALLMVVRVVRNANAATPNDAGVATNPGSGGTSISGDITSETGDLVLEWTGIGQSSVADTTARTDGADQSYDAGMDIINTDNFRLWSSSQAGSATATMSSSWTDSMGRLMMSINVNASSNMSPIILFRRRR